jgi:two-component system, NtrC family, nitrogen regulation sensor histidine kinase NtrY
MVTRREPGASLTGMLSLILLYVVLIVLVLVFATQVLTDLSFAESNAIMLVIVLALVFPGLLLAILLIRLLRLLRDRRRGRPGARLKSRLLAFFLVIVLLASVPQAVLSVTFIRSAVRAWFSEDTGRAIQGGQQIALSFFSQLERDLLAFAETPFLDQLLVGLDRRPDLVWERVKAANPTLDAFQVFDPAGSELFAAGDASLHLAPGQAMSASAGQVARESVAGRSFLRIRLNYAGGAVLRDAVGLEPERLIIISASLPLGFDDAATRLTQSLEFFVQLERFQGDFVRAVGLFYGFFSVPLVLLAMLVSFLLSDEILRPIVSLEEATRRVAEGDFSTRILTRRADELALLVTSFNRMVGELERSREKIIQTEKIAAWQEIAQRLAHEVKNPLTPIRLAAERALRKFQTQSADFPEVLESSVRSIVGEVDNLSALLSEFRAFSRLPAPNAESVDMETLLNGVFTSYAAQEVAHPELEVPEDLRVEADPAQIRQVFSNLVKNAVEAAGPTGRVAIRADYIIKERGAYCRVQIEDSGPGIPDDLHRSIYDPYMTTKSNGTGLGLAIVQRIVFDHGGQIWFETQSQVGTTFFVDLPVAFYQREAE